MATGKCIWCCKEVNRHGEKIPRFCSVACKAEWQRTQKPITKAWLEQKYLVEKLGTYQIARLVKRNPKQVWHWLVGFGIPLRKRAWKTELDPSLKHHNEDWLREAYLGQKKSAEEIGVMCGISCEAVLYLLKKFGIPTRNTSESRAVKHWGQVGPDNPMWNKRGEMHPNWRGGVTPLRQAFYSSCAWKKACFLVWRRDGAVCQRCGLRYKDGGGMSFHVHHLVSFADPDLRAEPNNLILLCEICHLFVHSNKNINHDFILPWASKQIRREKE